MSSSGDAVGTVTGATRCRVPRFWVTAIALLQGLALFALAGAPESYGWRWGSPSLALAAYTGVLAVPTLLMLSLCESSWRRPLALSLLFGVLTVTLGYYSGRQAEPVEFVAPAAVAVAFVLTMGVACFKALMYIQQYAGDEPISFGALFRHSWRNFLIVGLSLFFVAVFWGLLQLGAALFDAIGIRAFKQLIGDDWFLYPVLALANGVAIVTFRNLIGVIDALARMLQAMIKFLLPLLVAMSLLFLAALPFTGLAVLWETRNGSLLVLWLQALTLFFVNAVYQDEHRDSPYTPALQGLVALGVAVLPVYSAIAFHGLYQRVAQYGWTVERCWGMLIWLLLTLFAIGYLWSIVRHRGGWLRSLGRVNIGMGLVVLAAMLLVNSPLLDFRKLALSSQLARLESGTVALNALDIGYISRALGRPGYLAMQDLKQRVAATDPDVVARIDASYGPRDDGGGGLRDPAQFRAALTVWPADWTPPVALLDALYAKCGTTPRFSAVARTYLLDVDLDGDGVSEPISVIDRGVWHEAMRWRVHDGQWSGTEVQSFGRWDGADIAARLATGDVAVTAPELKDVRIGDLVLRPVPLAIDGSPLDTGEVPSP